VSEKTGAGHIIAYPRHSGVRPERPLEWPGAPLFPNDCGFSQRAGCRAGGGSGSVKQRSAHGWWRACLNDGLPDSRRRRSQDAPPNAQPGTPLLPMPPCDCNGLPATGREDTFSNFFSRNSCQASNRSMTPSFEGPKTLDSINLTLSGHIANWLPGAIKNACGNGPCSVAFRNVSQIRKIGSASS